MCCAGASASMSTARCARGEDAHGNFSPRSRIMAPIERLTVIGRAARSKPPTRPASSGARSSGCRRKCICATARSRTSTARCATSPPSARRRRRPARRDAPSDGRAARRRSRLEPERKGRRRIRDRGLRAEAGTGARFRPCLHRLRALARAFPRASSAGYRVGDESEAGGRARLGRGLRRRRSAGSPSTRRARHLRRRALRPRGGRLRRPGRRDDALGPQPAARRRSRRRSWSSRRAPRARREPSPALERLENCEPSRSSVNQLRSVWLSPKVVKFNS